MPPMSGDAAPSKPSRKRQRGFGVASIVGAAVVVAMLLACIGSLPYTLGRAHAPNSSTAHQPRRYEATNADRAMLPPFWAHHSARERARVAELKVKGAGATPVLGTDRLGRSILVRCLVGGAISLGIGFAAAA